MGFWMRSVLTRRTPNWEEFPVVPGETGKFDDEGGFVGLMMGW